MPLEHFNKRSAIQMLERRDPSDNVDPAVVFYRLAIIPVFFTDHDDARQYGFSLPDGVEGQ